MQSSKLPLVIKDSTITGEMDFDFFYQMIKIKLTLTVKNILYLFDVIVTPDQVYIKTNIYLMVILSTLLDLKQLKY